MSGRRSGSGRGGGDSDRLLAAHGRLRLFGGGFRRLRGRGFLLRLGRLGERGLELLHLGFKFLHPGDERVLPGRLRAAHVVAGLLEVASATHHQVVAAVGVEPGDAGLVLLEVDGVTFGQLEELTDREAVVGVIGIEGGGGAEELDVLGGNREAPLVAAAARIIVS